MSYENLGRISGMCNELDGGKENKKKQRKIEKNSSKRNMVE